MWQAMLSHQKIISYDLIKWRTRGWPSLFLLVAWAPQDQRWDKDTRLVLLIRLMPRRAKFTPLTFSLAGWPSIDFMTTCGVTNQKPSHDLGPIRTFLVLFSTGQLKLMLSNMGRIMVVKWIIKDEGSPDVLWRKNWTESWQHRFHLLLISITRPIMKPDIFPVDAPVVESISGDSLNDDSLHSGVKKTKVRLTADEATEIALGTIDEEFAIESENSPYPEVRANVPNTDDVDLPVNTVRMWFLGIVFTMVCHLRLEESYLIHNF